MSHLENFTESTLANNFYDLKVLKLGVLSILILEYFLHLTSFLSYFFSSIGILRCWGHRLCDFIVIWISLLLVVRHV